MDRDVPDRRRVSVDGGDLLRRAVGLRAFYGPRRQRAKRGEPGSEATPCIVIAFTMRRTSLRRASSPRGRRA
jgi:hypothetical protein